MKKLALIVALFLFFFTKPPRVNAGCTSVPATAPIGCTGQTSCGITSGGQRICCDEPDECSSAQQEVQTARMMELCEFARDKKGECESCFKKDPPEAWTAIGCIPTTPSGFIGKFLSLGVGIAGGIAFLLILFSGFQMITSVGNPEKLNAGKELLTAAISGLILIIFSIFLLKLIGVDILGLPEFQ